jgi:hypothetical protein
MPIEIEQQTQDMIDRLVESLPIDQKQRYVLRHVIAHHVNLAVKAEIIDETRHLKDFVDVRWMEHRLPDESPVDFVERVYQRWLGNGLTRALVREVDPQLYRALYTWEMRHGRVPLDLPTQREVSAAAIAQATALHAATDASDTGSHAGRLLNALRYRAVKNKAAPS